MTEIGTSDAARRKLQQAQAGSRTWEVTPDLMGALNARGYFETSNPAWMTILGWSEAEVAGTSIWELLHPDDLERTRGGFELTQIGQPAIKFPNRYRCKDGSYRWISWVGVPEDGYVYCTGRDITDDVAAGAERDRLWTLSEDMLARADYAGKMSAVNPAWTAVLGWTEAELLTNPYADIIHPDDVPATVDALQRMGATGQPTRFENRILTSERQWKAVGWTVSPEPDGANFIAVGRDLSDYKAREAELVEAQEALRQAQKMEAVGQLTGGLAHDFNNILAGISGSLELMQSRLSQGRIGEIGRHIAGAQEAAKRAASLTHRLLAFSRRQTLDPKAADVNAIVAGIRELIDRSVGPAVRVRSVPAEGLWTTMVDAGQLENAVLNLCINARDAMPEGGAVTIETQNLVIDERTGREWGVAAGPYVRLGVSDSGVGMTAETMKRAFEPFFTTKALGQGTGLGLSMVYGFAGQSNGTARISSEVGMGTTVSLYLPRHAGAEDATAEEPVAGDLPRSGENQTILVVDDEPLIRMVIAEILDELGYRVLEAGDGAAALKMLAAAGSVDLLVTDVGLPNGMNGKQLADLARGLRPDLPVLFVTGYAENAVLNHNALTAGMHVMTKPFQGDAFARRVRDLVATKRTAG